MQLRIPGPTPLPPQVLAAMGRQMINHRGKEFSGLIQQVIGRLQTFFQTRNDVLLLTASGTGGMEAAVVNMLSPGDPVLCISNGFFGDRFSDISRAFGAEVTMLTFEWGKPIDVDAVRRALAQGPRLKAIQVVQNETSTGVANDITAISAVAHEFDKLILVDSISGLGAVDLPVDRLGLDVVVSASQKAWMSPPGLAMISVSQRAWEAQAKARMPRCYFDLAEAKKFYARGQTPWTPAVGAAYGLAAALELMAAEGLSPIVARHERIARKAREGVKALGLSPFADERYASTTVTSVRVPEGVDAKKLLQVMYTDHNIELAGGQQKLEGKIFRIGHLGWVNETEIDGVLKALAQALPRVGYVKTPVSR
ncbi:MAG: alanine--glyoxylate aminotransferase family protein [Chloroflexi bacterium]|nr:alanine--glyoxylate aminotransferase family protein [Chloroflexota bacterium]